MPRTITVGLDGSPESRAAAEWAAREAQLRGLPVKLVQVWEPVPAPTAQAPLLGAETRQHWTERVPRESADGLRLRHPGVEVSTEQLSGRPAETLVDAAKDAELPTRCCTTPCAPSSYRSGREADDRRRRHPRQRLRLVRQRVGLDEPAAGPDGAGLRLTARGTCGRPLR